jgi:TonB family protein
MMVSIIAFGQIDDKELPSVNLNEVMVALPTFTGIPGSVNFIHSEKATSLEEYLQKNIIYPEEAVDNFIRGTEVIKFVVTPEGNTTDFKVINSVSRQIDQEVIRVLKTTNGMWMPAHNNEKHVAMVKEVSIPFDIAGVSRSGSKADFKTLAQKYSTEGSTQLLVKNNPKKALKSYDKGILLRPNDKSLLLTRGMARYQVGDKDGATRDWARMKELGDATGENFFKNFEAFKGLKGYNEMISYLDEKFTTNVY